MLAAIVRACLRAGHPPTWRIARCWPPRAGGRCTPPRSRGRLVDKDLVHYRYKFDYEYLSIPQRKGNSKLSSPYALKIVEK
jgi:hypothetical protein